MGHNGRSFGDLHLFPHEGKETLPFEVLAQGTQAGTARRHCAILRHQRTPSSQGDFLYVDPSREYIALQEFALPVFQPR
jgi:hypothetical protein